MRVVVANALARKTVNKTATSTSMTYTSGAYLVTEWP